MYFFSVIGSEILNLKLEGDNIPENRSWYVLEHPASSTGLHLRMLTKRSNGLSYFLSAGLFYMQRTLSKIVNHVWVTSWKNALTDDCNSRELASRCVPH